MNSTIAQTELATVLRNRCAGYQFLARVYREEASVDLLQELARQLDGAPSEEPAGEGNRTLREFAASLKTADLEQVRLDLAAEFANLFLSMGAHPIPPFESVYASGKRLLMQEARDQVLKLYRQAGLDRSPNWHEAEDHIAIEFEFMAFLCSQTLEQIGMGKMECVVDSLEQQKEFLDQHLIAWVPKFTRDLEQAAGSAFYRGVSQITREYLTADQETVRALMDEVQMAAQVVP